MPQVPYPITAESAEELRQQVWELMRQLFEDRIGGLEIGDVFQDSGDVLTIKLLSSGGLAKSSNSLTIQVTSTGGLQLTSSGIATKLKSGGGITSDADGLQVDTDSFVSTSIFDANTILKADADNTPEALTVAEQTLVGRITAGEITGLTATQVRTLLALATTDSPVFVTAKLSGLGDGKIPYHVDDATGLADGPTKSDVDAAVAASHAVATVADTSSIDMSISGQEISGAVLPAGVDHSALGSLDSVNYTHLTAANHTDLTDGGATTLHKHDHGNMDGLSDNDHPQYDDIIINRNIQETTANYTLAAGYNGVVLGPFAVGNGFTFTIADGSRFMVLND